MYKSLKDRRSGASRWNLARALLLGLLLAIAAQPLAAESLERARALLAAGRWEDAAAAFRALPADEAQSGPALYGLAQALYSTGDFEGAAGTARDAANAATGATDRALALTLVGRSLRAPKKKKLYPKAAEAFREALEADPTLARPKLSLAELMLLQKDDKGARPLLEELAAREPSSQTRRAAALLRNPRKVEYASLPEFTLTTLDGREIGSGDLGGNIVLFDFWATWCGPCVASIPDLAKFHQFSDGKPLELISVSADRNGETLKSFVRERAMDWAVVHDARGALRGRFGVNAYPTYLLVDSDGFIVARASGYSPSLGDPVDRLVRQAKSMAKKLAKRGAD